MDKKNEQTEKVQAQTQESAEECLIEEVPAFEMALLQYSRDFFSSFTH